ncbi:MAG: heme-binding protein [Treponema sp.]|nr:heme-binding protein [Treponema sp.]
MNIDRLIGIVEKQEDLLQFPHFDRKDALDLGNLLVKKIQDDKLNISISIRLFSGLVVFQYLSEGATLDNERWLTKKFNTVKEFESSTLLNTLQFIQRKWTFESRGLDPRTYVWGGGGFPVRIEGTGVIGAVIVSGLPHIQDHGTIVDCISDHLEISNVPRVPLKTKI